MEVTMSLEGMYAKLLQWLEKHEASEAVKGTWEELWNQAQDHPGKPLPCPTCILQLGAVSRLESVANDGELAVAYCPACKSTFKWPDEA
jgi:hypothetical protein